MAHEINVAELNNRVVRSGKEFNEVLEQLIEAAAQEGAKTVRSTGIDLYTELVESCPKDTGRAAAGFNIRKESSEWTPAPKDFTEKKAGQAKAAAEALKNTAKANALPLFSPMTISNNVEYLIPLENGSSPQKPGGFIALSIRNAMAKLTARLNKLSGKKYG